LEILVAIKRFLFASNKTFSKLALQKGIARRVLLLTNEEKVHTSPSFLVSELDNYFMLACLSYLNIAVVFL
jgi:hypothetical protein